MNKPIRSLILAGGFGKRLKPLTLNKPKCLVEINKKPILELWINKLEDINVEKLSLEIKFICIENNFVKNFLKCYPHISDK